MPEKKTLKNIVEANALWFILGMIITAAAGAYRMEALVRAWAESETNRLVVNNVDYRETLLKASVQKVSTDPDFQKQRRDNLLSDADFKKGIEEWATNATKAELNVSDEKRIEALFEHIVARDDLREKFVQKISGSAALRSSLASAISGNSDFRQTMAKAIKENEDLQSRLASH